MVRGSGAKSSKLKNSRFESRSKTKSIAKSKIKSAVKSVAKHVSKSKKSSNAKLNGKKAVAKKSLVAKKLLKQKKQNKIRNRTQVKDRLRKQAKKQVNILLESESLNKSLKDLRLTKSDLKEVSLKGDFLLAFYAVIICLGVLFLIFYTLSMFGMFNLELLISNILGFMKMIWHSIFSFSSGPVAVFIKMLLLAMLIVAFMLVWVLYTGKKTKIPFVQDVRVGDGKKNKEELKKQDTNHSKVPLKKPSSKNSFFYKFSEMMKKFKWELEKVREKRILARKKKLEQRRKEQFMKKAKEKANKETEKNNKKNKDKENIKAKENVKENVKGKQDKLSTGVSQVKLQKSETEIDALLRIILQEKNLSILKASKLFAVKREVVENWMEILETHKLITINYPAFGSPVMVPYEAKEDEKEGELQ